MLEGLVIRALQKLNRQPFLLRLLNQKQCYRYKPMKVYIGRTPILPLLRVYSIMASTIWTI